MKQSKVEKLLKELPLLDGYDWNGKDMVEVKRKASDFAFTKDYEDGSQILCLSAEKEHSQEVIADYYGEFRGGYPWINSELTNWAEERDLFWEWENPAVICLYEA